MEIGFERIENIAGQIVLLLHGFWKKALFRKAHRYQFGKGLSFTTQFCFLMTLKQRAYENFVGKGEKCW